MSLDSLTAVPLNVEANDNLKLPSKEDFKAYLDVLHAAIPDQLTHAPLTERVSINIDGVEVKVWTKDLHKTSIKSFKGVGAFLAMWKARQEGKTEVVAASAGNHAQGVAISAAALKMKAVIYMPVGTSAAKVDATKRFGGKWVEVVLEGEEFKDSKLLAEEHVSSSATAVPIAPYDDQDVIDGQGLHIYEVFKIFEREEMLGKVDAVLMGIGGGGLFAGSMQVRHEYSPETVMIGVEQEGAHCAKAALKDGNRNTLPGNAYAAGTNVPVLGAKNYDVIIDRKNESDDFVTVNNAQISIATNEFTKLVENVETAGALGTAALMFTHSVRKKIVKLVRQAKHEGRDVVNVVDFVTGGNITPEEQVQRKHEAEIAEGKRKYIELEIPENKPGALKGIARILREQNVNIIEFKYSSHSEVSEKNGQIVRLGLAHQDKEKLDTALRNLSDYRINHVSHEEAEKIAHNLKLGVSEFTKKLSPEAPSYHKFSLQIKQKSGSLLELIERMPEDLNIEFFDYVEKSSEEDYGRVEIGFSGTSLEIEAAEHVLVEHYRVKARAEVLKAA